jgi:hypothetical protein
MAEMVAICSEMCSSHKSCYGMVNAVPSPGPAQLFESGDCAMNGLPLVAARPCCLTSKRKRLPRPSGTSTAT